MAARLPSAAPILWVAAMFSRGKSDMEKTKTPLTEEQKTRRRVARLIGRTAWFQDFKAQHPEATKEEREAAWKDARKTATKRGARLVSVLEKKGYSLSYAPPAEKPAVEAAE
jgi:hypothetical protein